MGTITKLLESLLSGLSLGSIYALIALGYTMVYGIAKMLNFAHGDIIMAGAFSIIVFTATCGLPAHCSDSAGHCLLHAAGRHGGVPGLSSPSKGFSPGGADHRHRRKLPSAERGAADSSAPREHRLPHQRGQSPPWRLGSVSADQYCGDLLSRWRSPARS